MSVSDITYRPMKEGEEEEVCQLVMRVFGEFVAPGYSDEGVASFSSYVTPVAHSRRNKGNHFTLVATESDTIIGMIEFRTNNHVSLMFVDEEWQTQGIGKTLFEKGLAICLEADDAVAKIDVNSSPNAAPIYESLGFRKCANEQTSDGIRFIPMIFEAA
ncbi:GNAT family N-acetyltransferase [Candidatus Hydrogenedentota bacterium]